MAAYTTRSGQNMLDVAVALHGTVEGVFDLLVSNSAPLDGKPGAGAALKYHEQFSLNSDMAKALRDSNVIVKNGEHWHAPDHVQEYMKDWVERMKERGDEYIGGLSDSGVTSFLRLFSAVKITVAQSGLVSAITARPGQNVYIAVDWGDFSDPDVIGGTEDITVYHSYKSAGKHTIRIYGDMNLQRFDLSKIGGIYYVHSLVRCGEFEDGLDIPSLRTLIQTS